MEMECEIFYPQHIGTSRHKHSKHLPDRIAGQVAFANLIRTSILIFE